MTTRLLAAASLLSLSVTLVHTLAMLGANTKAKTMGDLFRRPLSSMMGPP